MTPILTDESGRDLFFIKVDEFYGHSFSFTVSRVEYRNEDGAPAKILRFASGYAYSDGFLTISDVWIKISMLRVERWEWEEQSAAVSAIYDFAEKTFNERKKALQVSDDQFNRLL